MLAAEKCNFSQNKHKEESSSVIEGTTSGTRLCTACECWSEWRKQWCFSLIVPLYPLQRLSLRVWENVSPNGALSMTFYISLDLHKSDGLQPI